MNLIQPALGLLFWQTLIFLTVLMVLSKYGWKPILRIIKERECNIEQAINQANETKKMTVEVKKAQQQMLAQVAVERDKIIADATAAKAAIMEAAAIEAEKIKVQLLAKANQEIIQAKSVAFTMLKGQVAIIAIQIAEKLLNKELQNNQAQQELLSNLTEDTQLL